jgi:hypothetical protein
MRHDFKQSRMRLFVKSIQPDKSYFNIYNVGKSQGMSGGNKKTTSRRED